MIKSIRVWKLPERSDMLTMELESPINIDVVNKIGLAIDSIEGLGPVEADINTTEMVVDGDLFNSARVGKRNIVLNLVFYAESGDGIETARRYSYQLFPIKKLVNFEVITDTRKFYTQGYVEKNEPLIFSNMCTTQVSIICPDPKLYDYTDQGRTHMVTVDAQDISNDLSYDYPGEVATGCVLEFTINQDIVAPPGGGALFAISCHNLIDGANQSIMVYSPTTGFKTGDILKIGSEVNNKYVTVTTIEDGERVTFNALNIISQNPEWVAITPGWNRIEITDPLSVISSASLKTNICYEGV
jgi:hypothetical protein